MWALTVGDGDDEGYIRVGRRSTTSATLSDCAVTISKAGLSQKAKREHIKNNVSTVGNYFQALGDDDNNDNDGPDDGQAHGESYTKQHDICMGPTRDGGGSVPKWSQDGLIWKKTVPAPSCNHPALVEDLRGSLADVGPNGLHPDGTRRHATALGTDLNSTE